MKKEHTAKHRGRLCWWRWRKINCPKKQQPCIISEFFSPLRRRGGHQSSASSEIEFLGWLKEHLEPSLF